MLDRAECMLARAGRQSGLLVGALFIDIDWFKDVNERLGDGAGDQILKIVAERLEGVVRAGDTVGRLGATSSCCWSSPPRAARAWTRSRGAWSRRCTSRSSSTASVPASS